MHPIFIPAQYTPDTQAAIAQLSRRLHITSDLCLALENFLARVVPSSPGLASDLCTALHEYLTFDDRQTIENLDNLRHQPAWRPSDDDLIHACKQRDSLQERVDAVQKLCDEEGPGSEYVVAVVLPELKMQLEQAETHVRNIQTAIEQHQYQPLTTAPDPAKADPRVGIRCDRCPEMSPIAARFAGPPPDSTLLPLGQIEERMVKEFGWKIDGKSHLCPACQAKESES